MNEDGSPAINPEAPKAPETPDYSNPNDLDFELTPEQEQDFVNQILDSGDYSPPKPADVTPPAGGDDAKPTPPAPEVPAPVVDEPKNPKPADDSEVTSPQSDDLWIEVEQTIEDELGETTTKTVKLVYDPNDPSSFIPDDFTAKNTKQLAEIMDAKNEMAGIYKGRQADFDKVEAGKNAEQQEKNLISTWDAEIADLIKSGIMEAPKLKQGDEGYDKDLSVVKTDAVFQFLTEQNDARAKEGIAPITSFALAYTMFENSEAKKAADAAEKKDEEDTKLRGSMVGGGSAASGGTAEQKAYTAGSHNNIWSVPVED